MKCHSFNSLLLLAPALVIAGVLPPPPDRPHALAERAAAPAPTIPGGWSYVGCYNDFTSDRVLDGASYVDSSGMTNEACAAFCGSNGYTVFGTEFARECFCSYSIKTYRSADRGDDKCSMSCTGNSAEPCGAGGFLTVYRSSAPPPQVHQDSNGYQHLNCYSDDVRSRSLRHALHNSGNSASMTVDTCTSLCAAAGYGLAGLEFGGECWCDNVLGHSAHVEKGRDGCDMSCNGNKHEWCGGKDRIDLYIATPAPPAGWSNIGCWGEPVDKRALGVGMSVPGDFNNMTIEGCTSSCLAAGYTLAGLEYSRECYCASAGDNYGYFEGFEDAGCDRVCTGNNLEICGGEDRLNIYSYSGTPPSTSSNLVQNPGFEQGFTGWTSHFDHTNGGGAGNDEIQASGGANLLTHTGNGAATITGHNDVDYQSNTRGACLQQYLYVPKTGTYEFSFYLGSKSGNPNRPYSPSYKLSYLATLANQQFSGPACNNIDTQCTVVGNNGKNDFVYYSWDLTVNQGNQQIEICGEFEGVVMGQEDLIYVDDVSLSFLH